MAVETHARRDGDDVPDGAKRAVWQADITPDGVRGASNAGLEKPARNAPKWAMKGSAGVAADVRVFVKSARREVPAHECRRTAHPRGHQGQGLQKGPARLPRQ